MKAEWIAWLSIFVGSVGGGGLLVNAHMCHRELQATRQMLTAERQRTQEAMDAAEMWKDAARLMWPGLPIGHCAGGIDFRPDSTGTPTQRSPFVACQPGQDCRTTAESEKGGRK